MTRVTNFGIKRTYVEAGFEQNAPVENSGNEKLAPHGTHDSGSQNPVGTTVDIAPPKKKRKRTKMSKRDGNAAKNADGVQNVEGQNESKDGGEPREKTEGPSESSSSKPTLSKSAKKKLREKAKRTKVLSLTEIRRQKRINEKLAATTCFACREKGHAAKDCPVTKGMSLEDGGRAKSKTVVGICYRCGSTKHTLSRCKKPPNSEDPFPFASCFICNGKGHLVSSCPQHKAKGIYPNGGCCKLCGDTSHLARDCGLRKRDTVDTSAVLGTGREAGADEDDFHTFKRRNTEMDRDEKHEEKVKRLLDVKTGLHSGVLKPFGSVKTSTKKVVHF